MIIFDTGKLNFCSILNLSYYLESLFPIEVNHYGAVNLFVSLASAPDKINSNIRDYLKGCIFNQGV